MQVVTRIVNETYEPYHYNEKIYHHSIFRLSRTTKKHLLDAFLSSLHIDNRSTPNPKYVVNTSYPRLWDTWARENTIEGIGTCFSREEERRISEQDRVDTHSLDPEFNLFPLFSGNPKYANEFSFKFFNPTEPIAEVFPEGGPTLSNALCRGIFDEWRFSKTGPVFLARSERDLVFLNVPLAETTMQEWFNQKGWKISLSVPGRTAKQMLKQLNGIFEIHRLFHKGIIQLLSDLEKDCGLTYTQLLDKVKLIIQNGNLLSDPENFIEEMITSNILILGSTIQCPICTRYNWYQLNNLDYELQCHYCLSKYKPPIGSPKEMKFTYRAHGPFAKTVAQGAFSVLLTLKALFGNHSNRITPLFSYIASNGVKKLEADLTCLYKESNWSETPTHVVHAECKSYNYFKNIDLLRMKDLAEIFPGCILIFSTLNDGLNNSEKQLLSKFALSERRKRISNKPYSPVMILTATELYSANIADTWGKLEGKYEKHKERARSPYNNLSFLAEATQEIYLDLPPLAEWIARHKKAKKRRESI